MPGIIFGYTVALLVLNLTPKSNGSPIIEYDKGLRYEEYIVEHEISAGQAKNAALSIDLNSAIYTNNDIDSPYGAARPYVEGFRRRCPVCDSSVYGYCSDKLFHDSCCCHNPNNPYDRLPYQCHFADCSFLHANTCHEHKLITACCCTNILYKK